MAVVDSTCSQGSETIAVMNKPNHQDDVIVQHERSLTTLSRAITHAQGRFTLILVRCNYASLQEQILAELRQRSGLEILAINLRASSHSLYSTMTATIGSPHPNAVIVFGIESLQNVDDFLVSLNRLRDDFLHNFPFPLVLWINDFVQQKLIKLAPDFYSYAPVPIRFAIATEELFPFLPQEAEEIFRKITYQLCMNMGQNMTLNWQTTEN
ncbi:WD-40 repeat-containing protein [Nostoc carneum NIES-2107]|nr:WD-40 repeat-containing protein [Nostoc carneum NIES-2107]